MIKKSLEKALFEMDPEIVDEVAKDLCEKRLEMETTKVKTINFKKRIVLIAAAAALVIAAVMIPLVVMMSRKPEPSEPVGSTTGEEEKSTPTKTTSGTFEIVQSGSYESVFIDDSSSHPGFSAGRIDFWGVLGARENNPNARLHIQVSFGGATYNCEYSGHSSTPNDYDYGIDYYFIEDTAETDISMIMIERETEKLRGVRYITKADIFEPVSKSAIEQHRAHAKEIASLFISVEEYDLSEADYVYGKSEPGLTKVPMLVYTFVKKVGSIKTRDKVVIQLTPGGDLLGIELSDIGRYDEIESGVKINEKKLNDSIKDLMSGNYDLNDCKYEVKDRWLTVSFDGKLLIVSDVFLTKKDGVISYKTIITEV
ncbi:MAG: hypothetical protein IJU52_02575 [Clostridia bacterium]|nr:hypothetical protein [Clostridia bacterium]